MVRLNVNGVRHEVQAPDDTPLLYVLRNDLELTGPQFGCGLAQCGACSVLIDGKEVRSCITAISRASRLTRRSPRSKVCPHGGQSRRASRRKKRKPRFIRCSRPGSKSRRPQCGFCQNGMMIKATELLESNPHPDRGADQRGLHHFRAVAESVPLRNLHRDHRRRTTRRRHSWRRGGKRWRPRRKIRNVFGATLSRRQFREDGRRSRRGSSALIGTELLKGDTPRAATLKNSLDPTLPSSWIEIHPDNTILIRTGKNRLRPGQRPSPPTGRLWPKN